MAKAGAQHRQMAKVRKKQSKGNDKMLSALIDLLFLPFKLLFKRKKR